MSLGADVEAPVALSVAGAKKVWENPEVTKALLAQDKVRVSFSCRSTTAHRSF